MNPISLSIHKLPPMEIGGVEARRGFGIQDHVALSFCLELLKNDSLEEVWCENQDDSTLIWNTNGQDKVEFVQVKGQEFDQLWSVAKLCERNKKDGHAIAGSSILERSLAYDRCLEPCCFRVVTIRPVQDELEALTYPLGSEERNLAQSDINGLILSVGSRLGDIKSEKNNGYDYWILNTFWQVIHSLDSINNANKLNLSQLVEAQEEYLFDDQLTELYEKLLIRVHKASMARWRDGPEHKKLKKIDLTKWFEQQLRNIAYPVATEDGMPIQNKMSAAGISQDVIDSANDLRRHYREEILKPQYLKIRDMKLIEGEVTATLHYLRSQLDTGVIVESGSKFHARCLQKLAHLRKELSISPPLPLVFIQGCMYNIVNRCRHRFVRAET